jgi:hypothetical protein
VLDVLPKPAADEAAATKPAAPPATGDKAAALWKQPKVQLAAAAAGGALVASLLAVLITSLGDEGEVTAEPASTPQVEPAPQSTPPPPRPKPKPAPPRPAAPIAEKTKPAQQSESAAGDSSAQSAAKAPEVEVRASPEGALIFYGGKRVGETTARFTADPDKPKLLLVTKHGYIPQRMTLDGSETQVSVELERVKKEERGGHASGRVQQAADNPY